MCIQAVLFDLDNTLFDHQASVRSGLRSFLRHLQRDPSVDLERSWFKIEQLNYDRFLAKETSFLEQRRERLRQFLPLAGITIPEADTQLDELFAVYLRNYELAWRPFPDAAPALQHLHSKGIPIAVVTNGNHAQQTSKIEQIGLEPFLDGVFSSGLTGYAKPAPEAFLVACRSLDILPDETLYVGDNYITDVEGARAAGLQAVHLHRDGSGLPRSIRSLAELMTMMGPRPTSLTGWGQQPIE